MWFGRQPWRGVASVRAAFLRGFTLVELLITIAIAAILLAIAVPSFDSVTLSMKLTSYANNLVGSVLLARNEAINRNAVVSLCVSANGTSCSTGGWQQGWIVMCHTSDNISCNPTGTDILVIQRQPAVSSGWLITESSGLTSVSFQPTGTGAAAAALKVCRSTPRVGSQERLVNISATGRPSVTKTTTGVCT